MQPIQMRQYWATDARRQHNTATAIFAASICRLWMLRAQSAPPFILSETHHGDETKSNIGRYRGHQTRRPRRHSRLVVGLLRTASPVSHQYCPPWRTVRCRRKCTIQRNLCITPFRFRFNPTYTDC